MTTRRKVCLVNENQLASLFFAEASTTGMSDRDKVELGTVEKSCEESEMNTAKHVKVTKILGGVRWD